MTAGSDMLQGRASSETVAEPRESVETMARRVESARAEKVASRRSECAAVEYLTIGLSI